LFLPSKPNEGDGFVVHRPFPTRTLADFDPFLLLDEMGPMDLKPGEAKGVSGSSAPRV
jgi:quercetin 2,3-dioxygenase